MCTTNSVIFPTPTAARALCGSSAISWIELVRSTLLALASSADFLPSCHTAIRDPIAYPALRFRASTLLSRENVSPLRKFVSRSRAKMDQALFVRAGQRAYVDYCAEGGRSLGSTMAGARQNMRVRIHSYYYTDSAAAVGPPSLRLAPITTILHCYIAVVQTAASKGHSHY